MSSSESEAQLRQQIFLFSIGVFLVAYLIGLYRSRSFEWAMLTSSIAFGVTILAGAVLVSFVRLRDEPEETEETGPEHASDAANDEFRADAGDYGLHGQAAD